jgi:hypothetical protein
VEEVTKQRLFQTDSTTKSGQAHRLSTINQSISTAGARRATACSNPPSGRSLQLNAQLPGITLFHLQIQIHRLCMQRNAYNETIAWTQRHPHHARVPLAARLGLIW